MTLALRTWMVYRTSKLAKLGALRYRDDAKFAGRQQTSKNASFPFGRPVAAPTPTLQTSHRQAGKLVSRTTCGEKARKQVSSHTSGTRGMVP